MGHLLEGKAEGKEKATLYHQVHLLFLAYWLDKHVFRCIQERRPPLPCKEIGLPEKPQNLFTFLVTRVIRLLSLRLFWVLFY